MEKTFSINDFHDLEYYKALKGAEALKQRIDGGRIPIIDIAGYPFFSDMRLGFLRPWNSFETMGIDLREISMHPKTKQLSFEYHVPSMARLTIPDDATELPKDVVRVEVPNMYYLDPIGMARRNDKEPRYYYDDGIPLRMYRKAKIIPLEKTELLSMVNKNREQTGLPPLKMARQQTKTKKTRRKGI